MARKRKYIVTLEDERDGEDLTKFTPGAGGRRDVNGQLKELYKDPEPFDDYERDRLLKELEIADREYEIRDRELKEAQADLWLEGLHTLNNVLTYLNENPELVRDGVDRIRSGFGMMKRGFSRTKGYVEGHLPKRLRFRKDEVKVIDAEIVETEQIEAGRFPVEKLSSEEARQLLYETFKAYVTLKANLKRLANIQIDGSTYQINVNDVMALMDKCIEGHPELLDYQTRGFIFDQTKKIEDPSVRQETEDILLKYYR